MRICAIGLRGIPDVMGGIETHCEQLYPRLASIDTRLDITVIGRSGYARRGRFGNVRVVSLWAPKRKALETLIHTPLALLYARLFLHPHVVHLHAIGPGFFAPLARLLGFRVLATHHATDYDRPKWGRFGRWFLKTGERMLRASPKTSSASADQSKRVLPPNIRTARTTTPRSAMARRHRPPLQLRLCQQGTFSKDLA